MSPLTIISSLTVAFCVSASSLAVAEAPPPAAPAATAAHCTFVSAIAPTNRPFSASTQKFDAEYATVETFAFKGTTFALRQGHGVIRLEHWVKRKLVATAWFSENAPSSTLNLSVRVGRQEIEAQCDNLERLYR